MTKGLALSGGGFRATLFHLGVIRRLRAEGILNQFGCIASVSGGSIAAAHLLKNWDKYNSDPKQFDGTARELISFTQTDVRGQIQRRLPFLWILGLIPFLPNRWRISPTDLLAKRYDVHLYKKFHAAQVGGPDSFLILSTNLSRAELTCFGRRSVTHIPFDDQKEPTNIQAKVIPLADVVAASSAYPGFFPPIALSDAGLGAPQGSIHNQYFTDAGVYDNLGLYGLRKAAPESLERVYVSDAGRSFVPSKHTGFGIVRTALRAIDIFMFRVRKSDLSWSKDERATLISISQEAPVPGASPASIQSQLENIRTDLDRFSDLEVNELMRHGYYVTAQALARDRGDAEIASLPEWDIPAGSWLQDGTPEIEIVGKLQHSAQRRWGLFSIRDWVSWAHLSLIGFVVGSLIVLSDVIIDKADMVIAGIRAYRLTSIDPQWANPPLTQMDSVEKLDETINSGFAVVSDDRVWDLRQLQWREEAGGLKVLGPSLLQRVSELIRLDAGATSYKYRYQTAGSEFTAWSLDKDIKVRLLRSEQKTKSGENVLNTYEMQFDVSHIELNKKFVLRAQAKMVNAPWDRNNSWVGMRITDEIPEASMRIIFPKTLPYQRPAFQKYPNDTPLGAQTFDGIVLNRVEEKELLWRVDRPQKGWTYRVQWDWQ